MMLRIQRCLIALLVVAGTVTTWAVSASAGASPLSKCPSCGHNLILNPGAEAGKGTTTDSVVPVPDWTPTGSFTAAAYKWKGGDLSKTSPGPKKRGKNYFYGGPNAAVSTGTQDVTIASGGVSSGNVTFTLSGWLGGYDSQDDDTTLTATFENSSGTTLSEATIGPVTEAERGGVSELLFQTTSGTVPATTSTVVLELVMTRYQGTDNDGLADDLSLVLSDK